MNTATESQSMMVRPKDIKDSAIPSANAVATHVLAKLTKRTTLLNYPRKAKAILAAFSTKINNSPTSFTHFLSAAALLNEAEISSVQYAAKGAVAVRANRSEDNKLFIFINIKPGWHINAHQPLQNNLIPTKVSLIENKLNQIIYPTPIIKKLSFGQKELALYENKVILKATLPDELEHNSSIAAQVQLQACNDKHCLAPETIDIKIFSL